MRLIQTKHYLRPWRPEEKLKSLTVTPSGLVEIQLDPKIADAVIAGPPGTTEAIALFTIPTGILNSILAISINESGSIANQSEFQISASQLVSHLVRFKISNSEKFSLELNAIPGNCTGAWVPRIEARAQSLLRADLRSKDFLVNVGPGSIAFRWLQNEHHQAVGWLTGDADRSLLKHHRSLTGVHLVRLLLEPGEGIIFEPTACAVDIDTVNRANPTITVLGLSDDILS